MQQKSMVNRITEKKKKKTGIVTVFKLFVCCIDFSESKLYIYVYKKKILRNFYVLYSLFPFFFYFVCLVNDEEATNGRKFGREDESYVVIRKMLRKGKKKRGKYKKKLNIIIF